MFYLLRRVEALRPLVLGLLLIAVGLSAAQLRTFYVQAPMLRHKLPNQVLEGTVMSLEKKPDRWYVVLENLTSHNFKHVRFTLRGEKQQSTELYPGDKIRVTATLLPPSAAPTPGVYNFKRKAFFERLGAVGYALQKPERVGSDEGSLKAWIRRLRHTINDRLRQTVGGEEGAIAAALITGDRSGISSRTREAYAHAGIAHILAISGLHLAIVAGFIFFLIRKGLSLIPAIALRYSTKKIASVFTIFMSSFYLLLCWQSIPARRAYIMTTIVMLAILVDRSAVSLRNVMFAAALVLLFLPESLLSPSFQLSFSAVIALIAAYESLHHPLSQWRLKGGLLRTITVYFFSIIGTTVVATMATTPYSLFTFNQFTLHGIESNLLAIPLTTFFIMPLEVLNLIFMAVGLDSWTGPLLHKGLSLLSSVSYEVSSRETAALYLPQASPWGVILLTGGGLWLCLWRMRWRWLGVLPVVLGVYILSTPTLTDVYVDASASLVGIRDRGRLYVTSLRKSPFISHLWQRHGGNLPLEALKNHPSFRCFRGVCQGTLKGQPVMVALPYASRYKPCQKDSLYINLQNSKRCRKARHSITLKDLKTNGGYLIQEDQVLSTRGAQGQRPWT